MQHSGAPGQLAAYKRARFISQSGRCDCCGEPLASLQKAHLDHDHLTGQLRGLLCVGCNLHLDRFADTKRRLMAANYRVRWQRFKEKLYIKLTQMVCNSGAVIYKGI